MEFLSPEWLGTFWSAKAISVNLIIFFNLLGALILGLLVGYERSYHGHAAGMRTYGLVCMASAALTVIAGYPRFWFGGHEDIVAVADPTRVVQGIVTGIGFLGAGLIIKEGFSIRGLNSAASIWASSAIGVTLGFGFYAAAIMLAGLAVVCMVWVSRFEDVLPSQSTIVVVVKFTQGFRTKEEMFGKVAVEHGYDMVRGSLAITLHEGSPEWRCAFVARDKKRGSSVADLARMMSTYPGVDTFHVCYARV